MSKFESITLHSSLGTRHHYLRLREMPSSSLSLSLSSSSMDSSASSVYKRMMLPAIMVLMLSANAVQAQLQTCGTNRIVTMDYDIVGNDFQVQQNVGSVCECSTVCTRTPGCFIFSYSSGNRRCTVKRITTEANFLTIHMSAPSVEISGHLRSNIIVGTRKHRFFESSLHKSMPNHE
ncbi:hypothetical protein BC829DRAFT_407820 [Chytridium lagenaria]|nr:hypothetical protein BC829DRAFT_407820 [Chytridium lagenaria]